MVLVDKKSAMPYYEQLADLLRKEIEEKKPKGGGYRLPSENELAKRHGISRLTIRHALDVLERQGYIYREKGKGSFAAAHRVEHELTQLVSTTEAMRKRGWALQTKLVCVALVPCSPHVAHALELRPNANVYKLERLRVVDHEPLSLQTAYLPPDLAPQLEENDLTSSLYRLLESHYGVRLWTGRETWRARGATPSEAKLLQVKTGVPVLYSERVTFSSAGQAVEYLEAVWRGDRYDFMVTLARPPD
jgi:GntR family transcriptional regulator